MGMGTCLDFCLHPSSLSFCIVNSKSRSFKKNKTENAGSEQFSDYLIEQSHLADNGTKVQS